MNALTDPNHHQEGAVCGLRKPVVDDLLALSRLHGCELDWSSITTLQRRCYDDVLELQLRGEPALAALAMVRSGLPLAPTALLAYTLNRLKADYANIYLTHGTHGSPCESVWLDEDSLNPPASTLGVPGWYRAHGLPEEDWRRHREDHLVNQLRFLAHLVGAKTASAPLADAVRFMDEHPLRWVSRFAQRVAVCCDTRFYAGLALLTAAYLDELRDLLGNFLGLPRTHRTHPVGRGGGRANPDPERGRDPLTYPLADHMCRGARASSAVALRPS
ncbi:molecular chaperone TorD family protein [uncultured Thiodictyon sp.]|uniref:TorD/DmsD family molecular chaperone n=1 Tax=uncultured Thiodictyon sp. TaxID=1846217 RepID=UPI0025F59653|nr:molecular chaperone TorD family protein [uncultured Thiodictyon sp.]